LDPSIMDGDHDAPVLISNKAPNPKSRSEKDTHRRTRLHWEPLDEVSSGSIWALLGTDSDVHDFEIDEDEFAELFQAELSPFASIVSNSSKGSSSNGVVKVIDSKRANNGGIILARLRLSFSELAHAVDNIDCTAMTLEQIDGILEYIPTREERRSLAAYMRDDPESRFEGMCECEKFMVTMMSVRHYKRKILAMVFMLKFSSRVSELESNAELVENACDELFQSVRFRKILGVVLNIGNKLNTAGTSQRTTAGAIKLASLLKLNQAKAFDKKTTCLHYVALVVQRNNPNLARFKEDLPHVFEAEKVHWHESHAEVDTLWKELDNVRRVALLYGRQVDEDLGAMRRSDGDSITLASEVLGEDEEVRLLRLTVVGNFTIRAICKISGLLEHYQYAKMQFQRLLEYFGEEDRIDMLPHELFHIVVTFCKNYDVALSEVMVDDRLKKTKESNPSSSNANALESLLESDEAEQEPENDESQTISSRSSSKKRSSMTNVLNDIRNKSRGTFRWRRKKP